MKPRETSHLQTEQQSHLVCRNTATQERVPLTEAIRAIYHAEQDPTAYTLTVTTSQDGSSSANPQSATAMSIPVVETEEGV